MSWALLLLVLSTLSACASGQVLSQSSSVSASPGQTVNLPCTLSSGSMSTYYMAWYQQKHGGAPRYLLWIYSDSSKGQGDGVPGRFTVSKDTSSNRCILTISGVLAEDDAAYYCGGIASGTNTYIFGGGTQLNVLSGETKVPTLDVFPPSSEEVATNKATVVCLLSNFYPGSVTVAWKADDQAISSGVETTRPSKQSDNNLFMASSYLSVPAADWSTGKKYTCQATHESKIIEKSVKHSECV